MRRLLPLLFLACAGRAQLAAPSANGVSIGHLHLLVEDPEAQKKVWVEALGAQPTKTGTLELLRLPGVFVIVGKSRAAPAGGTDGSMVHHLGFAVKDIAAVKAKLDALGVASAPVNGNPKQIMAQFPEKIVVELTEEAALPAGVASMHHIHLATPDPEALRGWYLKTFGARAGTRGNFLAAFVPGGEVDTRRTAERQAPTKGRALDHIGFEVKGLEAFCKKLEAEGVKLETPYRDVPQIGLKIAFLTDPEGTRIELTEGLAGK
jgi:catechol 2,3-dioxygenase-like lactoylglutathione lyase family enzyme